VIVARAAAAARAEVCILPNEVCMLPNEVCVFGCVRRQHGRPVGCHATWL